MKNNENQNIDLNINKFEIQNINKNENNELILKYELTKEEIEKAKDNCYILNGKTWVGKTSLLNILYGRNIGKVGYSSQSETKKSNYYCIKEKLGLDYNYFCLIDIPGLYDTDAREKDKNQIEHIIKIISEEKIKIKE